ncbi:MAG: hypothetical protein AB7O66_15270 [Limisphaerales bacterium]
MKNESRLNSRHQEEIVPTTKTREEGIHFATPEDALRADRAATPVPDAVTERLSASVADTRSPQPASWWRRLLRLDP